MRATRRRARAFDPLADPSAVRAVCEKLREHFPDLIPTSEKQLIRFLYAVRHVERRPVTGTQRGRPGRWPREELIKVAGQLRIILDRETRGRVSLNSFIGQYLPIIDFPPEVTDALISGHLNLQEAAQLARLTPERLGCSARAAGEQRAELIRSHLIIQGSQTRLRSRVKELLGESAAEESITSQNMAAVIAQADELLEVDPQDTRHLFWEEMKRIFYAMRDVKLEDLDNETMEDFISAMAPLSNVLHKIEKKRRERERVNNKPSP